MNRFASVALAITLAVSASNVSAQDAEEGAALYSEFCAAFAPTL